MRSFALFLFTLAFNVGCASVLPGVVEVTREETTFSGVDQEVKVTNTDITNDGAPAENDASDGGSTGYAKTTTSVKDTQATVMCGDKPCVVKKVTVKGLMTQDGANDMTRADTEREAIKERVPYGHRTNGNAAQVGTPFGMYGIPTAPGFVGNQRLAGAVALAQQYQALRRGTTGQPQGNVQGQPPSSNAASKEDLAKLADKVDTHQKGIERTAKEVIKIEGSIPTDTVTHDELAAAKAEVEQKLKQTTASPSAPVIGPQPQPTTTVDPDPVADTQF